MEVRRPAAVGQEDASTTTVLGPTGAEGRRVLTLGELGPAFGGAARVPPPNRGRHKLPHVQVGKPKVLDIQVRIDSTRQFAADATSQSVSRRVVGIESQGSPSTQNP